MIISQDEYNVVKQTSRYLHMKINLLNYNFQIVDELSGTLVGDPTFTVNADSDMRRTCAFSLVPTNSSFDIKNGNKVWMDKYVKIYMGIENNRTDEITYSNVGIYMVHNPNSVYSATNNTITIQGIDLMAKLTGLRNGNLEGLPYLIPQNSSVKEAVIACLKEAGFNRYIVEEYEITTPYEIKIDTGGTVYNILTELRDILPNYQMYFDVDGIFHFEQIPSGKDEQIFIDDDIWNRVLIDYSKSVDFTSVKNVIEVFGKTHDVNNFGGVATINEDGDTYEIKIDSLNELRNYLKIGFTTDKYLKNPKLKINDLNPYPIKKENGTEPEFSMSGESDYYVVKFSEDENFFEIKEEKILQEDYQGNLLATIDIGTYVINNEEITELTDGMIVKFVTPKTGNSILLQPKLKINDLEEAKISSIKSLKDNTEYTVVYKKGDESKNYFEFLGTVQSYGLAKEENPDSPFYVKGRLGEIRIVLLGGEYDNIYTNDLAKERANWELYTRCKLKDSITLNCLPIYWAEVNKVISITLPNKQGNEETNLYIIKSINTTYGVTGIQSIQCMRYYPYYSNYVKNMKGE